MHFLRPITLTLILLTSVLSFTLAGQTVNHTPESVGKDTSIVENFAIWYRVDSITIDPNYLDNKRQMEHIFHYLDQSPRVDSITIYAWASPEGPYNRNKYLSTERAKAAKAFLLQHSPDSAKLNSGKIRISPIAENWQGLTRMVNENYRRSDRGQVLSILNDASISDQTRKVRLQRLGGGRTWRYLIDNYMPRLRAATWVCVWVEAPPTLPHPGIPRDTIVCHRGSILVPPPQPVPLPVEKEKKMLFAARTNLLVPALNVGLEFPIKNNWSVGIDYYYPWAVSSQNKWCGEMLGLFVDTKYWIPGQKYSWTKADRLQGHAIGAYAGAGYYDYQNIRHGYQGEYIDAGVDYTFGLPVGPEGNKWMRIEFNVGIGWIRTWARHYAPSDDFTQLIKDPGVKNLVFDYFGPTRASVSFLLPISATYKKKGGER